MPNIPTVGIFIPNGYLNAGSFASPSGQGDAYGNIYPSGLTPGKVIELSSSEAITAALPNTNLYDGAYQCVLLDSGATSALATQGLSAWIRVDSGANQASSTYTDYANGTVTTADQAYALSNSGPFIFAGIFVNPATVNGVSNAPTPGQYCFIFVGAGRAQVTYNGSAALTNNVLPLTPAGSATGYFVPAAPAASQYPSGMPLQATTGSGSTGMVLWQSLFYRIANQGV